MKKGSDNFRSSSILDVINLVKMQIKKLLFLNLSINNKFFNGIEIDNNLESFKAKSRPDSDK